MHWLLARGRLPLALEFLGIEGVKIDWRQQELGKTAASDKIGDGLPGKGEKDVGADGRKYGGEVLGRKAADIKDTGLVHLNEVAGLPLGLNRDGDR